MAGITSTKRSALVGGLALVLFFLTQVLLTSASFSEQGDFDVTITEPSFQLASLPPLPHVALPQFSLPQLPHVTLPHVSLPSLPKFSLPPLPSQVTIPRLTVPGFSIPPQEPLRGFHLPPLPSRSFTIPPLPSVKLPAETVLPPLPSLKFPGFSLPPQPAHTLKTPPFNPSDLTVPAFTFHTVSVPPTSFTFPRRAYPISHTQVIKN